MKGRELPSVTYRNCSRDSGAAPCVEMTVQGLDFRSVRRLPRHTSGNSPHGAPDKERSSYSPSALTRWRMLRKGYSPRHARSYVTEDLDEGPDDHRTCICR